jgi:hypothetical protein
VPEIGDELATARALYDLAQQLLDAATDVIKAITHRQPSCRRNGMVMPRDTDVPGHHHAGQVTWSEAARSL